METKERKTMHVTGNPSRRKASAGKRHRKEPQIQIVYTPAKPFNRNRFLLRLATVAAVVLALVLGMSIFFQTKQVTVSGTEKYTPWEIQEASGIGDGDGLLGISEAKISARIRTKLPYVDTVRVGIKLPDTVNIEITELDAVYAIEGDQSSWWLIDAQGRVVDQIDDAVSKKYTRIIGVKITGAVVGEQVAALEPEEPETTENAQEESSVPTLPTLPSVPARQHLDAALQILSALEKNGVMGSIDTVDVSDIKQLTMWYGDRYHVTLGDVGRLEYKVSAMKAAIKKMGEYQNGYLDVSFTTWNDQVGYTPFDGDINS